MRVLPQDGCNIRIVYTDNSRPEEVFCDISKELGIKYKIVYGKLEPYKNSIMGDLFINVDLNDVNVIMEFFNKKKVEAEVYKKND